MTDHHHPRRHRQPHAGRKRPRHGAWNGRRLSCLVAILGACGRPPAADETAGLVPPSAGSAPATCNALAPPGADEAGTCAVETVQRAQILSCSACGNLPAGHACCSVGGVARPYDVSRFCCTAAGIQQKSPIVDVDACPNRSQNDVPIEINGCSVQIPIAIAALSVLGGAGALLLNQYSYVFERPCDVHDVCYSRCNRTKASCDAELLLRARNQCDIRAGDSGFRREGCYLAAALFFWGVTVGGGPYWEGAQEKHCNCCAGDPPCAPPVTGVPEAGAGGSGGNGGSAGSGGSDGSGGSGGSGGLGGGGGSGGSGGSGGTGGTGGSGGSGGTGGITCDWGLDHLSKSFPGAGGQDQILIGVNFGLCGPGSPNTPAPWIHLGTPSLVPNVIPAQWALPYSVDPNPSAQARQGEIGVGNRIFAVSQAAAGATCMAPTRLCNGKCVDPTCPGGVFDQASCSCQIPSCTWGLDHLSKDFTRAGGQDQIRISVVSAPGPCGPPQVKTATPWIQLGPTSAIPNLFPTQWMVGYTVAANPSAPRRGSITVENRTFAVSQDGISPAVVVADLGFANTGPIQLPSNLDGQHTLKVAVPMGLAQGWVTLQQQLPGQSWTFVTEASCTSSQAFSRCEDSKVVSLVPTAQYRWDFHCLSLPSGSPTGGCRAVLIRP